MCGINGILTQSSSVLNLSAAIRRMNAALGHRGPDDRGYWFSNNRKIYLGQTRLSILDLSPAGHQPMKSSNNNVIVFNGEIFNYKDLNERYLKNEEFNSHSDTETILKLYNKYGTQIFKELNGMFAFAIWDDSEKALILARDCSGKKPLYFSEQGDQFSFSSEIKGLFELPWIQRDIDEFVLSDFLTYNTVSTPHTMFKGISKFKPGYYMVLKEHKIKKYVPFTELKYTKLEFSNQNELEDMVFNKLKESVKYRMISDVPVGAFLSGGVDSSAIVALMRDQTQQEIKTFTVDFEGQPAYSELEFAKSVSNRYNTNHFVKTVSKKDTLEFISRITEIYDEPQADTTAIPIYFISKLARENNIKVVLNGDGPDELFAGYSNYARYVRVNSYYNLASHAPKFIKGISSLVLNRLKPNTPISEMSSRLYNDQELMWPGASGIKESNKRKILSKEFMQKLGSYSSYDHVKQLKKDYQKYMNGQDSDYIQWLCYSGYKQAVIEKFLFRADRLGMANSIEARSPFLDHEMIELALSIPSEYKIKNGTTKYILKKSLERILPNEVLYRKKMGFCLPIREWAADTIGDYVLENINQFAKETGWFNQHEVIRQVKSLKNGKDETTNNIWTIYFLINWYKKWF